MPGPAPQYPGSHVSGIGRPASLASEETRPGTRCPPPNGTPRGSPGDRPRGGEARLHSPWLSGRSPVSDPGRGRHLHSVLKWAAGQGSQGRGARPEGPLIMLDTIQAQGGGQRRCASSVHRDFTRPSPYRFLPAQPLYARCPESDRYRAHWRPEDVEVSPGERCCSRAASGHQRSGMQRRSHMSSQNPGISAAGRALGRTALNPASGPAAIGGMLQAGEPRR